MTLYHERWNRAIFIPELKMGQNAGYPYFEWLDLAKNLKIKWEKKTSLNLLMEVGLLWMVSSTQTSLLLCDSLIRIKTLKKMFSLLLQQNRNTEVWKSKSLTFQPSLRHSSLITLPPSFCSSAHLEENNLCHGMAASDNLSIQSTPLSLICGSAPSHKSSVCFVK